MLNQRFIDYFRDTFFADNPDELQEFLHAIEKPIHRSIRIKREVLDIVKRDLETDGWILTPTAIETVFLMDRREDFDPLERRLGFSHHHLVGNFYIQELAAAHPVDILADHTVDSEPYLILDMASSPGGKTTQLTEYYPNSWIIANEPTRERIPQLLQNTERMGATNIGITLYPGQYWKKYSETFDRVLLDAPCSGEGTLYKGTDAVKHWHIKNIREIAKLQTKLLDAALHTLKVGGEMIYSTCSLNLLENEGVIETIRDRYPDTFEILYQKKFWPHNDNTGGFFVTKIKKTASLPRGDDERQDIHANEVLRPMRREIPGWQLGDGIKLYEHEGKILATRNTDQVDTLIDRVYYMRYGEQIGTLDKGHLSLKNQSYRTLDTSQMRKYQIKDEAELDRYLRGGEIMSEDPNGDILVCYHDTILGLEYCRDGIISSTFPREWQRR